MACGYARTLLGTPPPHGSRQVPGGERPRQRPCNAPPPPGDTQAARSCRTNSINDPGSRRRSMAIRGEGLLVRTTSLLLPGGYLWRGRGAVEVGLVLRPAVFRDLSAQLEAGHVVGLDVIAAHDARDAGHFGGGGEGRQLEGDIP